MVRRNGQTLRRIQTGDFQSHAVATAMLQLAGEKENGRTADHQIVAGQERCLIPNSVGIIGGYKFNHWQLLSY